MKKQFLLGLMAIILPLAGWALADDGAEDQKPLNEFVVSLTDDFEKANEITYKGSATVGVKVEITYVTPDGQQTSTLTEETHYTVSYTKDGKSVTTVKDAGNYTATITGQGVYEGKTATANFTIKKVALTLPDGDAITKKDAAMQYGASEDDELDIAQFVELTAANGLVDDPTGEELKDALKCLSLESAAQTGTNVGDAALFWVKANENSQSNNYEYKGDGVLLDKISIVAKTLTLAFAENKDHSVYTGTEVSLDDLDITGLAIVEKDKGNVTATPSLEEDKTEIKNAGDYKIKVSLEGTAAKNYIISYGEDKDALTYTVDRATIKVGAQEGKTLERAYNGKALAWDELKDYFSITGIVEGEEEEVNINNKPENESADVNKDPGYAIALYKGEDKIESGDFSAPTDLDNYQIEYTEAFFKITPKIVTYYFAGTTKKYTGQSITLSDQDYTVTILDGILDADEENVEVTNPKATIEGPVKNVDTYPLILDQQNAGSFDGEKAENYEFADAPSEVSGEATEDQKKVWNKFEVTPGTMTITVQPQTIDFGTTIDDQMKYDWAQFSSKTGTTPGPKGATGTAIVNDPYETAAADRTNMRNLITFTLSEAAQTGKSDTYTEGIKIALMDNDPTNQLSSEEVAVLYKNYGGKEKITLKNGTLIIKNVDETLVLDGSEGFDEESEDVEEQEPVEPEPKETVAQAIARLNGAMVDEVNVINLVNYAGWIDDEDNRHYADATTTFEAEKWYTLVLPFKVTVRELSEQLGYAIVNIPDENKSYFDAATKTNYVYYKLWMGEVEANTLMAFKVDKTTELVAEKGLTFKNKEIVAPGENKVVKGVEFVPVYEKTIFNKENGKAENAWYLWPYTGTFNRMGAVIDANRADAFTVYPLNGYINSIVDGAAARIFMEEADGSTTAINAVTGEAINNNAAEGWYTVGGMKLNAQPTQKGVYISNGKKVVIK